MKKLFIFAFLFASCSTVSSLPSSTSYQPIDYSYLHPYDPLFQPQQLTYAPLISKRDDFIKGVDISTFEEVILQGGEFFNEYGESEHLFSILKRAGINLVRIRLWHNPRQFHPWNGGYLDLETVTRLATIAKHFNMKWLLNYHYSDTWADPGNQLKPDAWKHLDFPNLVEAVHDYTLETMQHFINADVTPDYVQIGNETNNGML